MARKKFNDKSGFKTCHTCENTFKSTTEYFAKNIRTRSGLHYYCKVCDNKRRSEAQKKRKYHNINRRCKTCNSFFYASLASINKERRKGNKGGIYCSFACNRSRLGVSWNGARIGINNPNNKYPIRLIKKVKILLKEGFALKEIEQKTGVKYGNVMSIKNGRSWNSLSI